MDRFIEVNEVSKEVRRKMGGFSSSDPFFHMDDYAAFSILVKDKVERNFLIGYLNRYFQELLNSSVCYRDDVITSAKGWFFTFYYFGDSQVVMAEWLERIRNALNMFRERKQDLSISCMSIKEFKGPVSNLICRSISVKYVIDSDVVENVLIRNGLNHDEFLADIYYYDIYKRFHQVINNFLIDGTMEVI